MKRRLSEQGLAAVLDRWVGDEVAVRVVGESNALVAVFCARLGPRSPEKGSTLFWPLAPEGHDRHPERSGVYLHPGSLQEAAAHEGDFVLELRQTK